MLPIQNLKLARGMWDVPQKVDGRGYTFEWAWLRAEVWSIEVLHAFYYGC